MNRWELFLTVARTFYVHQTFDLAQLTARLPGKWSRHEISDYVWRLKRAGYLERLSRGVYCVTNPIPPTEISSQARRRVPCRARQAK